VTSNVDELVARVVAIEPREYYASKLPDERDETITALVRAAAALPETERAASSASLNAPALVRRLETYVRRMAALAVREKSEVRLRDALTALALNGCESRGLFMMLSLAQRSAEKLGLDGAELLRTAARLSRPADAERLLGYAAMAPANKKIETQGWREVEGPDGFDYRSTLKR